MCLTVVLTLVTSPPPLPFPIRGRAPQALLLPSLYADCPHETLIITEKDTAPLFVLPGYFLSRRSLRHPSFTPAQPRVTSS
ncbi:hypothetical protein E2C01_080759 [Portunus trituberculatus]|uniref:Uncharacterized protein n=1 Tax=Portunus trituberculatus TaxID=210409 RepID=A0A5B7IU87_PORTR|nr:hypothetical protein [Portunus trituberculatus]